MFAVIKTGGKQYKIASGDKFIVEKLSGKEGEKVIFDQVLLVSDDKNTRIGKPNLDKATVETKIIKQDKSPKIKILKFKPKKRYKKLAGHRQFRTQLEVQKINI